MKKIPALICALAFCVGCQTGGRRQEMESKTIATPAAASSANSEKPSKRFTFRRAFEFVGFTSKASTELPSSQTSITPRDIPQLGNIINSVAARSYELNISDRPEVTRQKAHGILEALSTWENLLVGERSAGVINENTARHLNSIVQRLRTESQKLVYSEVSPEAINSVKQLAEALKVTYGGLGEFLGTMR